MMGSFCHCQQVVTFFFFFFFFFFGLLLTTWVKGPTLTLCPGPLNFSGRPCTIIMSIHLKELHALSCCIAFRGLFADFPLLEVKVA